MTRAASRRCWPGRSVLLAALALGGCGSRYVLGSLPGAAADASIDARPPNLCASGGCDSGAPDPCAGHACGAVCTTCGPSDVACVKGQAFEQCTSDGGCSSDPPACASTPYAACAGKRCGEACHQCDPNDPNCVEGAVQQYCDTSGQRDVDTPICVVR